MTDDIDRALGTGARGDINHPRQTEAEYEAELEAEAQPAPAPAPVDPPADPAPAPDGGATP